mgnify:FL=1
MATSDEKVVKVGRLKAFWADALAKLSATFAAKSHEHDAATRSAAGFMSADDKAKLDGLSGSGGSDDLLLAPLSDTRELEDLAVQSGSFDNAGSGWNTFVFPEAFDDVPQVLCVAENGYGVEVKGVQADRFLYRCVASDAPDVTASKSEYYVFNRKSVSTNYLVSVPLVTDVSVSGGDSASTSLPCRVMWLAIEYGGD